MARPNFYDLFDTDYIKELINKNSNKLIDELYYHLNDNGISISEDQLHDIVDEYISTPIKKDIGQFYDNSADKYNYTFKTLDGALEYVNSNGKLEGKSVDESAAYVKDMISQVDINIEEFKENKEHYNMDNYYDDLLNKVKSLLTIYKKEDCYNEIREVIENAKEKNNQDCSLEYRTASIESLKALQEVNYQMLGTLNNTKNKESEVKDEDENKKERLKERFLSNLKAFENKSGPDVISHDNNGEIVSDYISSNTIISSPFITDTNCKFKLDDPKIYTDFLEFYNSKELSIHYNFYNCMQEYLENVFGKWGDFVTRDNIYKNHNNNDEIASIKDFYGNNSAGPIERAAVAHNCMKLMGAEDYLVLGSIRKDNDQVFTPYAYNVVKNVKGNFMLYDPFDAVKLEDGNTIARADFIENLHDINDFNSHSFEFKSFLHNVSKHDNHKNEYVSPNYYKNMNNNLSNKADEMIRQMEKGIDVEGTGEYDVGKAYGKQMGYTMLSIVSLLSIIACIGIIVLGVLLFGQ